MIGTTVAPRAPRTALRRRSGRKRPAGVCDDELMTSAPTSTAGRPKADRLGAVAPTREEFRELAVGHRVIPVTRRLLADDETPSGSTASSPATGPGTFLLESAENGRSWSRWSFVGVRTRRRAHRASTASLPGPATCPAGLPTAGDPLAALRTSRSRSCTASRCPGCRRSPAGMVGYLGYDVVRRLERLPDATPSTTCACPSW